MIEQMPEEFTVEQMMDRLKFIEGVEKARQSYREGRVKSMEEVRARIEGWSK